jgi:hypothetical protein
MMLRQGQRLGDAEDERVYRSGTDSLAGNVPVWVKAITLFGVPSSIAMYLVYIMAGTHSADVKTTNELLQSHIKLSTAIEQRQEQQSERLSQILLALCVNGAKDEQQRSKCVGF